MLSQYDSSESPTVSPMNLMVYPAHDSSPPPEDSNVQYMYSRTDSTFYRGDQWNDCTLTRMSIISPMLPCEDAYAQSPVHHLPIWETSVAANGPDLTYSESPKPKPVLYGHQTISRGNTPAYMTCPQLRNKDYDQDGGTASHPSPSYIIIQEEPAEGSAAYVDRVSTSQSSNCDEADAQCIDEISYRFHNDVHNTYRTNSPVQSEASNPCSPGKGIRKAGISPHVGKTADEIDVEDEEIPYAQLIYKALMSVPSRTMILGEIYRYFRENIPRFSKMRGKGWQNSIRHNLSMNGAFRKVERPLAPDGSKQRGYYWVLSREAEEEGVKSTTRFRKNSSSSRRNPDASDHKEDIPLSHRRKKTRSAAASKPSSRKSSRTPTAKSSPSRAPSPAAEFETTVHACVQVKENDPLPDMQPHGATIIEDTPLPHGPSPQLCFNSSQNFDPTIHPALYTSMWDLQPANHYYADSYSSGPNSYDENINSIFNEEFALLRRSQALQPVLSSGYSSPPQWPTLWPLR
ncbi:hypothetical protein L211DRAFT_530401 [Terfezia boudieri ATCC MYA-4762]|uniref:Fork-head domain-containing protein n=1 Tax=Terfezia boudieri ATCC MYA-4762 TaxID=1051890 RepID=A0A3N4LBG5_9PEZI|nr:hypothetical protein L211DRAFT_530401 [Terfezia boudieri ATCC MYA-4762]